MATAPQSSRYFNHSMIQSLMPVIDMRQYTPRGIYGEIGRTQEGESHVTLHEKEDMGLKEIIMIAVMISGGLILASKHIEKYIK
jgi:hypothetical protein